jgi:3-dehydroquinate dehydratase type II
MSTGRILVVNGPNLNLLGTREPAVYGSTTLAELEDLVQSWGSDSGVVVETFQSNHEGAIIDRLHAAAHLDGIVINAGAFTHYSYAIHDALVAIDPPAVEIHISNIKAREAWRRHSVTEPACVASIYGRGIDGYRHAIEHLVRRAEWPVTTRQYGDGPDRVGDMRVPAGSGPHPVVVLLHGGFWHTVWMRDLMDGLAVDLVKRGWATWNPEYHRVGNGGGWPTTFEDVARAVDWLATAADDFQLDLGRVVVMGHSAGGHLALWAAARNAGATSHPRPPEAVVPMAAVGLAPVADLAAAHRLDLDDGAVEAMLRRGPDEAPNRYAAASPAEMVPLGVPQLIVHGDADSRVPVDLSREYVGAAADAGDTVVYDELEGVDHFALIDPTSVAWSKVVRGLDQLLG